MNEFLTPRRVKFLDNSSYMRDSSQGFCDSGGAHRSNVSSVHYAIIKGPNIPVRKMFQETNQRQEHIKLHTWAFIFGTLTLPSPGVRNGDTKL